MRRRTRRASRPSSARKVHCTLSGKGPTARRQEPEDAAPQCGVAATTLLVAGLRVELAAFRPVTTRFRPVPASRRGSADATPDGTPAPTLPAPSPEATCFREQSPRWRLAEAPLWPPRAPRRRETQAGIDVQRQAMATTPCRAAPAALVRPHLRHVLEAFTSRREHQRERLDQLRLGVPRTTPAPPRTGLLVDRLAHPGRSHGLENQGQSTDGRDAVHASARLAIKRQRFASSPCVHRSSLHATINTRTGAPIPCTSLTFGDPRRRRQLLGDAIAGSGEVTQSCAGR